MAFDRVGGRKTSAAWDDLDLETCAKINGFGHCMRLWSAAKKAVLPWTFNASEKVRPLSSRHNGYYLLCLSFFVTITVISTGVSGHLQGSAAAECNKMAGNGAEKSGKYSSTLSSRCFCIRHDATRHRLRCVVALRLGGSPTTSVEMTNR